MKWVIIFLLLITAVAAQDVISSGEIKLLALMQNDSDKTGSVVRLSLELVPGDERVFLETFPMTKVTTQASLRLAQQISCKQLNTDCSNYDFLFRIRSIPGIVGGPSAGAAAAFLTSALLLNKTVPDNIAMTGTINSGGLIGPVGGLKYKVEAAAKNDVDTVYLAKGTKDVKEEKEMLDLVVYGRDLNLTVKEVATLGELLQDALGVPQEVFNETLQIEPRYQQVMREVSNDLCQRSAEFLSQPLEANLTQAINFTKRAARDQELGAYYAAASYCFRANVDYKRALYQEQNLSVDALEKKVELLKGEAESLRKEYEDKEIKTLTDLQTFMAVMERIDEGLNLLKGVERELKNNRTDTAANIGFAEERLFSAVTWARFFNGEDKAVVIDNESLKEACAAKISEAEERYNYVKSVIPEALDATRKDIDAAYNLLRNEKYVMCVYTASKAKSEADVLLSLMGVEDTRISEVIELKLDIARQALIKSQQKNIFPIIAYSYYEYASSLKDFDRVSSLLFSEYALELANLDIYFQEKKPETTQVSQKLPEIPPAVFAFITGFAIGGLIIWIIMKQVTKREINMRRSSRSRIKTLQAPRKRRLRGKKR